MIITPNLGLTVWNLLTDPYDNSQLADNWARVDQHDHSSGKGVQINGATGIVDGSITSSKFAINAINPQDGSVGTTQLVDGSVTTPKLADANVTADKLADATRLGLSSTGVVRRGAVITTANESTTSTTFANLTTPDVVSSVLMPTAGLIHVLYCAYAQSSVSAAGSIGLFMNTSQVVSVATGASPVAIQASTVSTTSTYIYTNGAGLSGSTTASPVTLTGQTVGFSGSTSGIVSIFAGPGTCDVSVKYKVTSGNMQVANRRLWVWTQAF